MAEPGKIVIIGAGKIGRSFIGQLFGRAGYRVVFIDADRELVEQLNRRKCYTVVVRGDREEKIIIGDVRAVHSRDEERCAEEIAGASLLALSVGKNSIQEVVPMVARGLTRRYGTEPDLPLDIIIAENMRDAAEYLKSSLVPLLPEYYPVDRLLGLVETSIGKMVPILKDSDAADDPLRVFAEPYNELILDGSAFRSGVPLVEGLAPKEHIKAWVDRKAFIHNLGHAAAAYRGFYVHPDLACMYEVLQDPEVYRFTREVMVQGSGILEACWPGEFTPAGLEDHIDDLLTRFGNRALGDTVFRVGHDLPRKLGPDDRFMGTIRKARQYGKDYDKILEAMVYGLLFRGKGESGNLYPADLEFAGLFDKNPVAALEEVCGIDPENERKLLDECLGLLKKLRG